MGHIYVIGEGNDSPVKIGFTMGTAVKRLAELQIGHYRRLHIIASAEVPDARIRETEKYLHLTFHAHAIRGEWFAVSMTQASLDELLKGINILLETRALLVPTPEQNTLDEPHDAGLFLVPESIIANFETDIDNEVSPFTYTYGPEDQEVEITIESPYTSEDLAKAQETIDHYLAAL